MSEYSALFVLLVSVSHVLFFSSFFRLFVFQHDHVGFSLFSLLSLEKMKMEARGQKQWTFLFSWVVNLYYISFFIIISLNLCSRWSSAKILDFYISLKKMCEINILSMFTVIVRLSFPTNTSSIHESLRNITSSA